MNQARTISQLYHLTAFLMVLVSTLLGCNEEETVDPSAFVGVWNGTCTRLLSDKELAEESFCNDPDSLSADAQDVAQACFDKYSRHYYKDTLTIRNVDGIESAKVTIEHPQLTYLRATFYNTDPDYADDCRDEDRQVDWQEVYSFQLEKPALLAANEVTVNNGFPADAKAIDMQLFSASMTFHFEDLDSINSAQACEFTDWEKGIPKDLTDRDNCYYSSKKQLSDRSPEELGVSGTTWDVDGNLTSSWSRGKQVFGIYKSGATTTPVSFLFSGPFYISSQTEDTTVSTSIVKDFQKRDGTSDETRHNQLTYNFTYDDEASGKL